MDAAEKVALTLALSMSLVVSCKTTNEAEQGIVKRVISDDSGTIPYNTPVYTILASGLYDENNPGKSYPKYIKPYGYDRQYAEVAYCLKYDETVDAKYKFAECKLRERGTFNDPRLLFVKDENDDFINLMKSVRIKHDSLESLCKKASRSRSPSKLQEDLEKESFYIHCGEVKLSGTACCFGLSGHGGCPREIKDRYPYFVCPFEKIELQDEQGFEPMRTNDYFFPYPGDGMVNSGYFKTYQIRTRTKPVQCIMPNFVDGNIPCKDHLWYADNLPSDLSEDSLYINTEGTKYLKLDECSYIQEQKWIKVSHRNTIPDTYCSLNLCKYENDAGEQVLDYTCVKGVSNYDLVPIRDADYKADIWVPQASYPSL